MINVERGLSVNSKIDNTKLYENKYTMSLINEGIRLNMISLNECYKIQSEIMQILKENIMRYTKGKSTSLAVDITQMLLESIMYAIDMYCMKQESPDIALLKIRKNSISKIYNSGVELVKSCFDKTIEDYKKLYQNRLKVEVDAYNATLKEGIQIFLKKYDIVFGAQHSLGSIDYPLALIVNDLRLRGVLFIKEYIRNMSLENMFCNMFDKDILENLLVNYGKSIGMNYKIELFNIFEITINNMVFCIMGKIDFRKLILTEEQRIDVIDIVNKKDDLEISIGIDQIFLEISEYAHKYNKSLKEYILSYKKVFKRRLFNAIKHNNLKSMIITQSNKKSVKSVFLSSARRMSNSDFIEVLESISIESDVKKRVDIIKKKFNSLEDYIDLFNSGYLYKEDYDELFKMLENTELAVLSKLVFYENLRDGKLSLDMIKKCELMMTDEWKTCFVHYIKELSNSKMLNISKLINLIDFEEVSLI